MLYRLKDIIELTGAEAVRWNGPDAVTLVHDGSRTGNDVLFVPGRAKGIGIPLYDYLRATRAAGIVLPRDVEIPSPEEYSELGVLLVDSVVRFDAELARHIRLKLSSLVIGVTGSVGKSSTKDYIAAILGRKYRVLATHGSDNRSVHCRTIIESLEGCPDEAAVIEMGFQQPDDVSYMAYGAIPQIGVITKIAPQHLAHTGGSIEVVAREKCNMARWLHDGGFMVVNGDDLMAGLLPIKEYDTPVLCFGSDPSFEAAYTDVSVSEDGTTYNLMLAGEAHRCRLKAVGRFQAANATAAALVASRLGFAPPDIVDTLENTVPPPHRFAVHRFNYGFTLIDDTYGAGYHALIQGADLAAQLAGDRAKIALVSDLTSLGEYGYDYHLRAGRHLVERGFEEIIILGINPDAAALREGAMLAGLGTEKIHIVLKTSELVPVLSLFVQPDTLMYCKTQYNLKVPSEINKLLDGLRDSAYGVRAGTEPQAQ